MKAKSFYIWFLLKSFNLLGSNISLPTAQNSDFFLITVGLGPEFEMRFGHTILEIQDTKTKDRFFFNWGAFDFNTPNFAWKFFSRKLLYWVDISKNELYLNSQRSAIRQKIFFTEVQKQKAIESIKERIAPENKKFFYDFFYKNCATIPRDIIDEALSGALKMHLQSYSDKTFRNYVQDNLLTPYGTSFILDILMNSKLDEPLTFWDESFYPPKLADHLSQFKISDNPESNFLLSEKKEVLLPGENLGIVETFSFWPWVSLIFLLSFFLLSRLQYTIFSMWFWFSGFLGLVMILCHFFSGHETFWHNANLYFFWPTDILLPFFSIKILKRNTIKMYGLLHLFMIFLWIIFSLSGFITQNSHQLLGLACCGPIMLFGILWKKN